MGRQQESRVGGEGLGSSPGPSEEETKAPAAHAAELGFQGPRAVRPRLSGSPFFSPHTDTAASATPPAGCRHPRPALVVLVQF